MRKAALVYNPASGAGSPRRQSQLQSVVAILRNAGVDAQLTVSESSTEAAEKARQALAAGCDTIFACGGDGTIHNLVQVLANSSVALAILPMGTANALAHDLGIPRNLAAAAKAALDGAPRRVALGHVKYTKSDGHGSTCYFVIAAGVGVDAHLFYGLHGDLKRRLGMAAYYAKAWHLWFRYPMTRFLLQYSETGSEQLKQENVTEMLGVRIRYFGGVLQELAPGASLDRNDLRLIFCRTASRWAYISYVAGALLRRNWRVRGIELVHAEKVSCQYVADRETNDRRGGERKIYVEADGELLGTLPAEITVVPNALTLLAPRR
jgi:diacylglycerol kinase (ATP)